MTAGSTYRPSLMKLLNVPNFPFIASAYARIQRYPRDPPLIKESVKNMKTKSKITTSFAPSLSLPHPSPPSTRPIITPPNLPKSTQPGPISIQQKIRGAPFAPKIPKPSIPLDPRGLITPFGRVLQKLLHHRRRVIGTVHSKLGDPDRVAAAAGDVVRLCHVVLEVVDVVGRGVPV